jgi:hypothetical protein
VTAFFSSSSLNAAASEQFCFCLVEKDLKKKTMKSFEKQTNLQLVAHL